MCFDLMKNEEYEQKLAKQKSAGKASKDMAFETKSECFWWVEDSSNLGSLFSGIWLKQTYRLLLYCFGTIGTIRRRTTGK